MRVWCTSKKDRLTECHLMIEKDSILIHETFLARVQSHEMTQAIEQLDIKLTRKLIIEEGVEPVVIDTQQLMPLLKLAVESRDVQLLNELFKQKLDLHTPEADKILEFAMKSDLEIASMLVRAGVRLKPRYVKELLKIHWHKEYRDLALLMIDHGVKIHECERLLSKAMDYRNLDFAEELLKRGAMADFEGESETRNIINERVWDAFCEAVSREVDAMELLIKYGFDVTKKSQTGIYPVYVATRLRESAITELLIGNGANVHQANDDKEGQYPIHIACEASSYQNIKLLASLGVDFNVVDKLGRTPFSILKNRPYRINCKDDPQKFFIKCLVVQIAKTGAQIDNDLSKKSTDQQIFFQECSAEVQKMKSLRILDYYSFFRVFSMSVNEISYFVRNTYFVDSFRDCHRNGKFVIYFNDIIEKLKNSIKRKDMLAAKEEAVYEAMCKFVPDLVIDKIVYYLYLCDM